MHAGNPRNGVICGTIYFPAACEMSHTSLGWAGMIDGLKKSIGTDMVCSRGYGLSEGAKALSRYNINAVVATALLAMVLLAACSTVPKSFHPSHPVAPAQVSHDCFNQVLGTHVIDGLVDYPGVQGDRCFSEYLTLLARVDPNGLPVLEDRLVFWINAYNALAMKGIIDHYSPLTLWGRYRYFIGREYTIGGEAINLYNLEQRILIPFHDPRIHFAIVCASASCPRLQSWTYQPERIHEQLDHVARLFVNDPERNRFDRQRRIAYLSKIFDWFAEDFVEQSGSLQRYVGKYMDDPELAKELDNVPYTVKFLDYDWSLNGTPPGKDQQ